MLVGTALYVHLLVYAGLSLFIINGLYIYIWLCVVYAYNLTVYSFIGLLAADVTFLQIPLRSSLVL